VQNQFFLYICRHTNIGQYWVISKLVLTPNRSLVYILYSKHRH
jgi:hypothetical protein